ncbi:MAG: PSD1 domain-containing protein [Pirellulaceae bacterium]|nr:PSD1 domain-containing protein [Pirellulaceae bacterium]
MRNRLALWSWWCALAWLPALVWLPARALLLATEANPTANTPQGVAYFENHVRPLLVKRCYACHAERSGQREGGLLLDSRAGWAEGGERGPAVVPGDVGGSLLIQAVRYARDDLQMPPDRKLPPHEVAQLEQWVRLGAPDPRDRAAAASPIVSNLEASAPGSPAPKPSDPEAGKQHWAYRPLRPLAPPAVQASDWPRSAVDNFVLARLEAEGLRPAPDADRRVLVRRLYFQLHGLPPTSEQVAAFLADQRPDAWPRLVDQLLEAPQFGERWGRHWLDLARYADSNGLDENFLFREAWRYRNWVLAAFRRDLPFDRFLLEQLAGDLLPWDSVEQRDAQRIAAGFLVLGPKVLLGNNPENQKMEVADEQLDTIGRAILGQTLGCARCHDHKFDPVPTADYYALAGILTSTQVLEQRYMLGEQRVMEQLVGLGADGESLDGAYEEYWRARPQKLQQQKDAQAALKLLEQADAAAWESFAGEHASAVADGARDVNLPAEQRLAAQRAKVAELDAWVANPPPIPPRAMVPLGRPSPADEFIRVAGQFDRQGQRVPRGLLRVLSDTRDEMPADQSGRVELARWLVDTRHGAGHLTARVLANRVWHHLVGRGIVRTVDNFGRTGESPTHPELLDYLAGELVSADWSLKSLVRKIVLSRTFAMSSEHQAAGHAIDPDNALLWRAHRRRLDPEAMRDAMLAAADQLDWRPMESTVWYLGDQATAVGDNKNRRRTDFPCRSVYLPVIRNDLPEIFDVFDFANPHAATGMRPQTTVATQGLFLLNDQLVMDAATATARRLLTPWPSSPGSPADEATASHEALGRMFEWILNVPPTEDEYESMLAYIQQTQQQLAAEGEPDARLRAWALAVHALFASSRFQLLE